jgi:hypothetical protein
MQRRELIHRAGAVVLATLAGLPTGTAWALALTESDAALGVREALARGTESAIGLLGRKDGFLGNPKVRIPLPGYLDDAAKLLRTFGQGKRVDTLVTAMNRAAESAVPAGRDLLVGAVRDISVEDALKIVRGGDNAVTRFFERKTRAPLTDRFLPIVTQSTEREQLARKYNAVAGKAQGLGLVKKEDATIEGYVTRKSLDGLYFMIGEEEKKIRADPIGTGSAMLRRVFGI